MWTPADRKFGSNSILPFLRRLSPQPGITAAFGAAKSDAQVCRVYVIGGRRDDRSVLRSYLPVLDLDGRSPAASHRLVSWEFRPVFRPARRSRCAQKVVGSRLQSGGYLSAGCVHGGAITGGYDCA